MRFRRRAESTESGASEDRRSPHLFARGAASGRTTIAPPVVAGPVTLSDKLADFPPMVCSRFLVPAFRRSACFTQSPARWGRVKGKREYYGWRSARSQLSQTFGADLGSFYLCSITKQDKLGGHRRGITCAEFAPATLARAIRREALSGGPMA